MSQSASGPLNDSLSRRLPDWLLSVVVSLLIHLIIFLLAGLLLLSYLDYREKNPSRQQMETVLKTQEQSVMTISPDFFERVSAPPEPEEKSFARTSDDQEVNVPPVEAAHIGERDTQAASEIAALDEALAVPSQEGVKPRDPRQLETLDQQFADGDDEASASRFSQRQVATPPVAENQDQQVEAESIKPIESEEQGEALSESVAREVDQNELRSQTDQQESKVKSEKGGLVELEDGKEQKLLETVESIEVPPRTQSEKEVLNQNGHLADGEGEKGEAARHGEALRQSEQSKKAQKAQKAQKATQPAQVPVVPELQDLPDFPTEASRAAGSEVKKTALQGNISLRGKSSLAVQKTALGRYQATIGKAVEREWQKKCLEYRGHIVPGYLTVRFVVNHRGEVTQLDFVESSQSGGIQNGFTLSSIQEAKIPPMPDELVKAREGKAVDMVFSFTF